MIDVNSSNKPDKIKVANKDKTKPPIISGIIILSLPNLSLVIP